MTNITSYFLQNSKGMEVEILNLGGIIKRLKVPNRQGISEDIVLGFDKNSDYMTKPHPYFGAIVGRFANRIAKGKFHLNGSSYCLATNFMGHALHGGVKGFDKRIWDVSQNGNSLSLKYLSPDQEEGYPGNLMVEVTYSLSEKNEFFIEYKAQTDHDTIINLTNHSYFNLTGKDGPILDHELMINADMFTVVDKELIPNGKFQKVKNGPLDFTHTKKIKTHIEAIGGYDHNFVLNGSGHKLAATLYESKSGRLMEVFTTEPGLQFYSGNFLDGLLVGKSKKKYQQYSGLCLETQHFPDSPNHPEFPSTTLSKGGVFQSQTTYKFTHH